MTPTVLLHPIGLDRDAWQCLDLAYAMAIDLPGHGAAAPLPDLTLAGLADHVCGLLPGRFHVVGLSMGGMVAQHIALRHPNRVASLVIACASGAASSATLADRAEKAERGGMESVVDDYLTRWFTPVALADPGHAGVAYARRRLLADDSGVVAAYWRAMSQHDLLASLHRIPVPTTVVAGSADTSAPVDRMREVADRIPAARLRVVEGPHMLPLESPHAFEDALIEHFQTAP